MIRQPLRVEIRPRVSKMIDFALEGWVILLLFLLPGAVSADLGEFALGFGIFAALCVVYGSVHRVD